MTAIDDWIANLRQFRRSEGNEPLISDYDTTIAALQEIAAAIAGQAAQTLIPSQGRLTLTTGVPVTTTDVTAAQTLFWTPYNGNKVGLFNGTSFSAVEAVELSINAAALAADTVHDIFAIASGATAALLTSQWTSATARNVDLTRVNGVPLNAGAIGGTAAQRATYLGTIAMNGASRLNMMYAPAAANGGSGNRLDVWNMYNRVDVVSVNIDNVASYAYKAGLRGKNNSLANGITFVCGLAEDMLEALNIASATLSATTVIGNVAIGYDSAAAIDAQSLQNMGQPPGGGNGSFTASLRRAPTIGRHFVQPLEEGNNGAGTMTWLTTVGGAGFQQREGFSLKFRM